LLVIPAQAGIHFMSRERNAFAKVSLASAASELLSVPAESSQRLWRRRRRSNEPRVRSTALRCSPNGGRAELAHPCAQTCGACSTVRLRFSAPPTARLSLRFRPSMACISAGLVSCEVCRG